LNGNGFLMMDDGPQLIGTKKKNKTNAQAVTPFSQEKAPVNSRTKLPEISELGLTFRA